MKIKLIILFLILFSLNNLLYSNIDIGADPIYHYICIFGMDNNLGIKEFFYYFGPIYYNVYFILNNVNNDAKIKEKELKFYYNDKILFKEIIKYNEFNKPLEILLFHDSGFKNPSMVIFNYDKNNNLIKKEIKFIGTKLFKSFKKSEEYKYVYDENNKIVKETNINTGSKSIYSYVYNDNKLVETNKYINNKINQKYSYDENEKLINIVNYNSLQKPIDITTYKYNENNLLLEILREEDIQNKRKHNKYKEVEYQYDENNRISKKTSHSNRYGKDYSETFQYDLNDNIIKIDRLGYNDRIIMNIEYDKNKNIIKLISTDPTSTKKLLKFEISYKYY